MHALKIFYIDHNNNGIILTKISTVFPIFVQFIGSGAVAILKMCVIFVIYTLLTIAVRLLHIPCHLNAFTPFSLDLSQSYFFFIFRFISRSHLALSDRFSAFSAMKFISDVNEQQRMTKQKKKQQDMKKKNKITNNKQIVMLKMFQTIDVS